jgi:hypothetical protein
MPPIKDLIDNILSDNIEVPKTTKDEITVRKTYYEKSGDLKSEITVKNNKKHGPAKKYYPTGELHTLVNYVENVKEGKTVWYYKNGTPYRITQYKKGKKEGIRKVYYENGNLQAEIPFKNNELQKGTKEFNMNGTLISDSRKIIFKDNNLIKFKDKFILKMELSKPSKKVEFFEEKISTNGSNILVPINTKNGVGIIEYFVRPGSYIMKILKIQAKYKTKLGNPVLISTSYNLAIDNT